MKRPGGTRSQKLDMYFGKKSRNRKERLRRIAVILAEGP